MSLREAPRACGKKEFKVLPKLLCGNWTFSRGSQLGHGLWLVGIHLHLGRQTGEMACKVPRLFLGGGRSSLTYELQATKTRKEINYFVTQTQCLPEFFFVYFPLYRLFADVFDLWPLEKRGKIWWNLRTASTLNRNRGKINTSKFVNAFLALSINIYPIRFEVEFVGLYEAQPYSEHTYKVSSKPEA